MLLSEPGFPTFSFAFSFLQLLVLVPQFLFLVCSPPPGLSCLFTTLVPTNSPPDPVGVPALLAARVPILLEDCLFQPRICVRGENWKKAHARAYVLLQKNYGYSLGCVLACVVSFP